MRRRSTRREYGRCEAQVREHLPETYARLRVDRRRFGATLEYRMEALGDPQAAPANNCAQPTLLMRGVST